MLVSDSLEPQAPQKVILESGLCQATRHGAHQACCSACMRTCERERGFLQAFYVCERASERARASHTGSSSIPQAAREETLRH